MEFYLSHHGEHGRPTFPLLAQAFRFGDHGGVI